MADLIKTSRLDRTAIEVIDLADLSHADQKDRAYWMAQSPEARWNATELMRQINYGTAATSGRLQRVLEIAQLKRG